MTAKQAHLPPGTRSGDPCGTADGRPSASADTGPDLEAALEVALAAVSPRPVPGARRWWVTAEQTGIEVHAAGAVHLPTPVAAATRVGAGAALFAVRLAVAVSGFRPVTTLLPGGVPRSVVAIVRRGGVAAPTRVERVLFSALLARSEVLPRAEVPLPAVRGMLRAACDAEGVRLRTAITREERVRLLARLPASRVPVHGLLVLLGTDNGLPAGGLQAGQGLQRVLWSARASGAVAMVLAGRGELGQVGPPTRPDPGLGIVPHVLVHIGSPRGMAETLETASEDPLPGDRSHCHRAGRQGEPRGQELEEGS
jgi:hypothetical protein